MLLVGVNNELDSQPWLRLDWLLGYMETTMPLTRIVVLAPLPSVKRTSGTLQNQYRAVARRRPAVDFSTCGSNLDPLDTTLFADGLHLQPAGYRVLFNW